MPAPTISVNPPTLQAFASRITTNDLAVGNVSFSSCSSVSGSTASRMHDECAAAYIGGARAHRAAAQRDQTAILQIASSFADRDRELANQLSDS